MTGFRGIGLSIAMGFAWLATPAMATQYWELTPSSDPSIAIGTYTSVGGKTLPAGVNFTLKNNSADQPVALTLIATNPGSPLHLSAFKDDGQSFLDKDTDAKGLLVVRFRTADTMDFRVTGAAGSSYQLSLWRGPAIVLPKADPVVAMDALTGHAETGGSSPSATSSAAVVPNASPASPAAPPAASANGTPMLMIGILLGGILIVLVVIAVLIARGQKNRGNP